MTTHIKNLIRKLSPFPDEDVDDVPAIEYLPVAPTSRLWLPKLGIGDDTRFANIFRDTWSRIRMRDRRRIVKHWREDSRSFPIQGFWSPQIALVDDWELSDVSFREARDMGVCGRNGHSLYFYAPLVDALPVIHVGELIAHELAHVALKSIGEFGCTDRTQPRMFDDIEIMADEVMELWDFDPVGIDHWMEKNWIWPKR